MVNMNMIVNASDLVGYEAENKKSKESARKDVLAKLVAAWESKNAKSAKKFGTLGLLAVSLAACNNDDDDTASADLAAQLAAAQAAQAAAEVAQAAAEAAQAAAESSAAVEAVQTTLTTAIDTIAGTAANESLSAGLDTGNMTWQSLDNINMGGGTDTMVAIVSGSITPNLSGVEVLEVSNSNAATTIDLSASTGITTIKSSSSSAALTVSGIAKGTELSVANNSANNTTFNWTATDMIGTADSEVLTLSNVTGGATQVNIATGVETLTINSNGSATNNITLGTVNPTTLNVAGSASLTLAGASVGTSVSSVDASGASGTVTLTYNHAAANSYTGSAGADALTMTGGTTAVSTINLGAGNDTVTFTADLLGAAAATSDVVEGGDGTDTLVGLRAELQALTNTATKASVITGFETIRMSDVLTATTLTTSSVQATGITTVDLDAGMNANGTVYMGPGTVNLTLGNDLTAGTTLVVGDHAVAATSVTTDDVINISSSATAAENRDDLFNAATITVNGYETVNISTTVLDSTAAVAQDFGSVTGTPDTGGTFTVNFTGANIANIDAPITADVVSAAGMTAQATGTATFDSTGQAFVAVATTGITITGSPGDDVIVGDTDSINIIDGGAGADTITGGSANDTMSGGDGIDNITGNNGIDTINGGAGNDTLTGGTSNDTINGDAGDDTINAGAGTNDVVFGGEGNDTVIISADANLTQLDTYAGGDGTDTVSFTADMTDSAATFSKFSGFETLSLAPGAAESITMSNFTLNTFTAISLGDAAGNIVTIGNVGPDLNSMTLVAGAAGEDFRFNRLVDGTSDSLAITQSATATITIADLNIQDEETVTINSGALATDLVTYTAMNLTDATSLTITGLGSVISSAVTGATALATYDASATSGAMTFNGSDSLVSTTATAGSGVLTYTGGIRGDIITGGASADVLNGGDGADTINAGGGADGTNAAPLLGGGGDDTIDGGAGADFLSGGAGTDTVTGGTGADTFVIAANSTNTAAVPTVADADIIMDFVTGTDKMDVDAGVGAGTIVNGGLITDYADFIVDATATFAGGAGNNDVFIAYNAFGTGDTYIAVDSDDGGTFAAADDLVILKGINLVTEIALADFVA